MKKSSYNFLIGIFSVFSVVFFSFAVTGLAQIPGAMNETTATRLGGNNFLVGTVFTPSGKPISVRTRIQLSTPMNGVIIINTDDRGQFLFSGLSAGEYFIVVDDDRTFNPVSQRVEVVTTRNPSPQTYTITIRLTAKSTSEGKPKVVNQGSLAVPKRAVENFDKALELSSSGDHKGAIEKLKLAVDEFPAYQEALNELGVQYLKTGEVENALAALESALKLSPGSYEPMINKGIALFRLNRFDDAEQALRQVLTIRNQSAVAHYYLGRVLLKKDKFSDAESELKLSLETSSDQMVEAHRMLATVYMAQKDDKRAIDELNIYLKLVPNAPDAERILQLISDLKNPPLKGKN